MASPTDLLSRASQRFGRFYRFEIDVPDSPQFSAGLVGDDDVSATASVRGHDATFSATLWPAHHRPPMPRRAQATEPTQIYLDGVFATNTHWALSIDGWEAWMRTAEGDHLQLTIEGRCDQPPAEVMLARDRPVQTG